MELTTVKLAVTRDELKKEQPAATFERCGETINLPVEEMVLGMLHRMITEQREDMNVG